MWLVACQMASFNQEIKLSQGIVAVILMGVCTIASNTWLMPLIGYWHLLVLLVVWPLVIMPVLELSFRRSLLVVIIYMAVMVGTRIVVEVIARAKPPA